MIIDEFVWGRGVANFIDLSARVLPALVIEFIPETLLRCSATVRRWAAYYWREDVLQPFQLILTTFKLHMLVSRKQRGSEDENSAAESVCSFLLQNLFRSRCPSLLSKSAFLQLR